MIRIAGEVVTCLTKWYKYLSIVTETGMALVKHSQNSQYCKELPCWILVSLLLTLDLRVRAMVLNTTWAVSCGFYFAVVFWLSDIIPSDENVEVVGFFNVSAVSGNGKRLIE